MKIEADKVPLFKEVYDYARKQFIPGGTRANYSFVKPNVKFTTTIDETLRIILCDAQTSGGLLIAVPAERVVQLLEPLPTAQVIGEVIGRGKGSIEIV